VHRRLPYNDPLTLPPLLYCGFFSRGEGADKWKEAGKTIKKLWQPKTKKQNHGKVG